MTPPESAPPRADAPSRVLAASLDGATLVAVTGTANFKLAPAFKQAVRAATLSGSPVLVVDLSDCIHLDSTFMGAIAAAALAARKPDARTALRFLNIRPNVAQLLKGLGILPLLSLLPPDSADLSPLVANLAPVETAPLSDQSMTAVLYDAHETLARLSPENQAKFRDRLILLRADLGQPQ